VTTLTVPNFIPQNALSLKIPRYLNSPNFSPNVAEIPNLGTNSPKVGSLLIVFPLPNSSIEQWRMVVIVTGYTLFVTSRYDVVFTFANQYFAEVC